MGHIPPHHSPPPNLTPPAHPTHLSYMLHHYQNAGIQGRQIQCKKDKIQVSHVEKNVVEQSKTVPNTQPIRST